MVPQHYSRNGRQIYDNAMDKYAPATLNRTMDYRIVEPIVYSPFRGDSITVLPELSADDQPCKEDCRICCRHLQNTVETEGGRCVSSKVDCAA